MKKWLYKPDEQDKYGNKKNAINNELLLKWLDKYLDPKEWFIEITGGEPALYPEIFELIYSLSKRGYKGLIRTNGSLPLPMNSRFKRVAAWHKEAKKFPKYNDYIQILQNNEDDWKSKIEYCEDNNKPYCVFPYKTYSKGCTNAQYEGRENLGAFFKQMTTMFSSGALAGCFSGKANLDNACLQNMDEPIIVDICYPHCANIEALDYFILNAPGFKESFEIKDKDILPHTHFKVYPILNINNQWELEDGSIVGKLGDNIDEINKKYRKEVIT
jgi:hypothetical protein